MCILLYPSEKPLRNGKNPPNVTKISPEEVFYPVGTGIMSSKSRICLMLPLTCSQFQPGTRIPISCIPKAIQAKDPWKTDRAEAVAVWEARTGFYRLCLERRMDKTKGKMSPWVQVWDSTATTSPFSWIFITSDSCNSIKKNWVVAGAMIRPNRAGIS